MNRKSYKCLTLSISVIRTCLIFNRTIRWFCTN